MGKYWTGVNFKRSLMVLTAACFFALLENACVRADEPSADLPPQAAASDAEQSKVEREQFVKEIRRVENLNKKYTQEIEDVKGLLAEKDEDYQKRMKDLEDKMAAEQDTKKKEAVMAEQSQQTALELTSKTNEMLSKGGDLDPEDQQFKDELAKAHYNMGNIYYERGEYQRAVVEYYQAVDLAPNDPDIHYNLAFVSAEYLGDQETALKHYQWYLYLRPKADDAARVKEKILEAKFHLRAKIDSPLDKNNGNYNVVR